MRLPNPFRKQGHPAEPRSLAARLGQRVQTVEATEEAKGQARAMLEWMEQPYYRVFVEDYLRKNADEPVPIDAQLVANTARANTFKEIVRHLHQMRTRAEAILGER